MQKSTTTRRRSATVNKSCVSCRARKIKCDAAVVGIPCSTCASRHNAEDCRLPNRKGRTRKINVVAASRDDRQEAQQSDHSLASSPPHGEDSCENQAEPDLLYLTILDEALKDNAESRGSRSLLTTPGTQSSAATPQQHLSITYSHLDDADNDYLVRKGVYNLPHPPQLDALIKTYFDYVHPYTPVINKAEFIRQYQSGHYSLFLINAILAPATLNASTDVLSACGFSSRSEAQESFLTKAKLLHDFATESDPLSMLQGSVALCMIIAHHSTERDFGYWFHNAVRIATKLDIHNTCIREDKSRKIVKLYRRIWWALHSLDIFHVFANTKRTRLLEHNPKIKPRHEDDWEADDLSPESSGLLTAVTPQQRASSVAYCELSRISLFHLTYDLVVEESLSIVTNNPQQDPRRLLVSLDMWRRALPAKLHVENDTGTNVYYLNIQATSYRYECSLCRLIRPSLERSNHDDWIERTNQRLRSAILELDTIAVRVLASGTLQYFPISFLTTLTMLLALHIEAALDPNEIDLVRSMSRISISQIMLILLQGKEIAALKRALPIFEEILARKKLHWAVPEHDQTTTTTMMQTQPQQDAQEQATGMVGNAHTVAEGQPVPQILRGIDVTSESVLDLQQQFEADGSFDTDLLGFDFLTDWPFRQP